MTEPGSRFVEGRGIGLFAMLPSQD